MLPAYVGLFGGLGINYTLLTDYRTNQSPALSYASDLLPLPIWGVMFLGMALLMITALLIGSASWFRYALWLGIASMTIWMVVFGLAALTSAASPGAFLWPWFAATACYASNRSLLKGEV